MGSSIKASQHPGGRQGRRASEQQIAWQAVKKATGGNTAFAGNPAVTVMFMSVVIGAGGFILFTGLTNLSLGRNNRNLTAPGPAHATQAVGPVLRSAVSWLDRVEFEPEFD
ncbi:hypothetical protein T492DRAFT_860972 [Pavlovales sp. CCMP2436]|nr:hypothetical protein T492DRAFT_860972 [Pavlovales sp. CCMP2436]